jgi:hypothetical protein
VETISKIGFHILIANVAYFGLTYGAEWYNGKLIETMNENERLTEQIHEAGESYQEKVNYFSSERDAALKLLEEKQAELDSANKRVKAKKVAKPKAPAVSKEEAGYRQCVMREMTIQGRIDHQRAWVCACSRDQIERFTCSESRKECSGKYTDFKGCWANKMNSGLGRTRDGTNYSGNSDEYLLSKDAIDCWKRSCQ